MGKDTPGLEIYEATLREILASLKRSYEEAAAPIIKELARIEAMRVPKPIVIVDADRTD